MICSELIKRSMRRLGVLASGEDPTDSEAADQLALLQNMYTSLISEAKGSYVENVLIGDDDLDAGTYEAEEDQRISYNGATTADITLPATVEDEENGNANRQPADLAVVFIAGNPPQTSIYEAALGEWTTIEDLALEDEAPLSAHLGLDLIAMFSVVSADDFGVQIPEATIAIAAAARLRMIARMQPDSVFFQPDRLWR